MIRLTNLLDGIKKGDGIEYFDNQKRFRAGRVTKVGNKWVHVEDGEGKKKLKKEEINKIIERDE